MAENTNINNKKYTKAEFYKQYFDRGIIVNLAGKHGTHLLVSLFIQWERRGWGKGDGRGESLFLHARFSVY